MRFSKTSVVLWTIFVLSIFLRMQNFFLLPIDAHPMRQTDTESVAYFFATQDAHLLHPKASLIRPTTNSAGYFFLEFPAYQYAVSLFYRIFGPSYLTARFFNLVLFGISYWLLHRTIRQLFSSRLAFWTVIVYSLIPSSIFFFGHAIHPDLFAITMTIGALNLLTQSKRAVWKTVLAAVLMALAVGTRPFILMAVPSLFVAMLSKKAKPWEYLVIGLGSISIYAFWRWWQTLFPEADHSWQYWTLQGRETLFTLAGIKQLAWRNVSGEVIGRIASILAAIGFMRVLLKVKRYPSLEKMMRVFQVKTLHTSVDARLLLFCLPWLLAISLYWYIAPAGNAFHQYYANVFVLPIILLSARGAHVLGSLATKRKGYIAISALILGALLYNGIRTSSYFFNNVLPVHIVQIGREIEEHVPVGKKIVYLAVNNSVPFSLAHRQGWMLGGSPTDVANNAQAVLDMKQYGAEYVVYAPENNDITIEELRKIEQQGQLIFESERVWIFKI